MKILITGSAGFIGTNLVKRFAGENHVIGIDNLSRNGTDENAKYLAKNYIYDFRQQDITTMDFNELPEVDVIFHMAAQVGVQSSINDPINDLNQNIIGSIKVLEYTRRHKVKPIVIYASTNKVYGDIQVSKPVSEDQPLNFHTPYGVSKGCADQYVLDYSRIYGIKGIVFRQSCIYGEYQKGAEEQGWIDHFIKANLKDGKINFYGDGTQIRDVLYIQDLLDAYEVAIENIDQTAGQVYNVGGGPDNAISLNDAIKIISDYTQKPFEVTYGDWRAADQRYYVSSIEKIKKLGWSPKVSPQEGIERCIKFNAEN